MVLLTFQKEKKKASLMHKLNKTFSFILHKYFLMFTSSTGEMLLWISSQLPCLPAIA